MNKELLEITEDTVRLLKEHNLTLSCAESCTGGMLSSYITCISGVSDIYELGVTSYSSNIKHKILGVKTETLQKFGAVSEETAREMAKGIKKLSGSDIGLSVTGSAGPSPCEGHPPGYVFIGVSGEAFEKIKLLNIEPKSRNFVREQAVKSILLLTQEYIKEFFE